MKATRVIAVGSPYGDDRAAWCVADALEDLAELRSTRRAGPSLLKLDRPGPALLEHIEGAGCAVIIDAVGGAPPAGRLLRITRLDELSALGARSSHGFGLAETLRLAAALGRLPACWAVFGITIEPPHGQSSQADPISPAVAAAARRLARIVAIEIGLSLPRALGEQDSAAASRPA